MCIVLRAKWQNSVISLNLLPSINKVIIIIIIIICELFRVYDRVSVLQYDREYRYKQACTNFRWGTDIQHLMNVHLLRKPVLQSVLTRQARQRVPFTPASESNEVCRLYNSGRGCRFGTQC